MLAVSGSILIKWIQNSPFPPKIQTPNSRVTLTVSNKMIIYAFFWYKHILSFKLENIILWFSSFPLRKKMSGNSNSKQKQFS